MKVYLCVLAAVFTASRAIISQPLGCSSSPEVCAPRVITSCPRKDPIANCSTCCCDSSENVEFYDPDGGEPWCSAPPAVYTVKFVATWSGRCHPDYYPPDAHWSPPTGASHNTSYQMWDACMDNVSPGVAQVSQFGATTLIEGEYRDAGDSILDTFKASRIDGPGMTSAELSVDKYYQWVSVVSMLAPSLDRMVGVADLRLCDGNDWKRSVKVCTELFSTATRSERLHPSMQRNTIQWNNCSFGYFTFTFKEYQNASQEQPNDCQQHSADVCPAPEHQPLNCRTCCCKTSDNADFYHPGMTPQTECTAKGDANYKVSLIPSISGVCHPDYPFVGGLDAAYFSDFLLTSHEPDTGFDSCGGNPFQNLVTFFLAMTDEDRYREMLESEVKEGIIYDFYLGEKLLARGNRRRRSARIKVSPESSHVTLASKLLPSGPDNQWLGFTGLNLCGPGGWKESVEVCLPLWALSNGTYRQGNHCSFAHALIQRRDPLVTPLPSPTCRPLDESIFQNLNPDLSACCYSEFIIEGQIITVAERYEDARYRYNLLVRVTVVHYDEINHIEVGEVVTIKVCSLPFRVRFKRTYRLTGSRECGTNELEISETGIIANIPELGEDGPLGAGPCAPYILSGNCDDPIR